MDRAVGEGLARARGRELAQRLAERRLAVRVDGLAAAAQHQGVGRPAGLAVEAHDVDVRHAEVGGGELRHHLDALAVVARERRPDLRVGDLVELDPDAAVEGAVGDAVAVALEQLQQAVRDRPLAGLAGTQAVGDRRDQPVVVGDLGRVLDHEVERDERGLAARVEAGLDPAQPAVGRVVGRDGQAEAQRVDRRRALAAQLGVAGDPGLAGAQPAARLDRLGELAPGGQASALGRGAVAEPAARRPALPRHHGPHRHAQAVEAVDRELEQLRPGHVDEPLVGPLRRRDLAAATAAAGRRQEVGRGLPGGQLLVQEPQRRLLAALGHDLPGRVDRGHVRADGAARGSAASRPWASGTRRSNAFWQATPSSRPRASRRYLIMSPTCSARLRRSKRIVWPSVWPPVRISSSRARARRARRTAR
jgi:hypothetical protein